MKLNLNIYRMPKDLIDEDVLINISALASHDRSLNRLKLYVHNKYDVRKKHQNVMVHKTKRGIRKLRKKIVSKLIGILNNKINV